MDAKGEGTDGKGVVGGAKVYGKHDEGIGDRCDGIGQGWAMHAKG